MKTQHDLVDDVVLVSFSWSQNRLCIMLKIPLHQLSPLDTDALRNRAI